MAAGVGTRLEPLTLAVPKPMVPVCNVPIMQRNIELLKRAGFKDVTANLHYFPEQIQGYFKNGKGFGVNMRYSFEETLLGTAGGVRKMAHKAGIKSGTFVVLSSDVLMDIDLKKLVAFHRKKKALATIGLIEVEDTSQFGVVVLDKTSKIMAFQEKPKKEEALSHLVNTGVYVFDAKILELIPKDTFKDFGKEIFPLLVEKGLPFYGMKQKAYWMDIGNVPNYRKGNFDCLQRRVQGAGYRVQSKKKILIGSNCRVAPSVKLEGNVVIGDNCVIHDGCVVKDTIIWEHTVIGKNVSVDSSIIASWNRVGDGAAVGRDSVIASRCTVLPGSVVEPGSRIVTDRVV